MSDLKSLPKVELHNHLEGTLTPELTRRLASRNGYTLSDDLFTPEDSFRWSNFLEFLKAYDLASAAIRTPEDYRDVTYDYLKRCAAEGVIYVETMSSPDHAAASGMGYQDHLEGIVAGIEEAEKDFGITGRIIITCVRHLGPEKALNVARMATASSHPMVVGFGMGGDENAHSPADFAPAYNLAAEAGLKCNVHAGEVAGPQSVWNAINDLPVQRIGHGVHSIEDPALMDALKERGIALEVCPGSNIALSVYPDFKAHPLRRLYDHGIRLSLNSDDPPFFHTTAGQEYETAARDFGFSRQELLQVTRMALEDSFADETTKQALLAKACP
ncbi:adenosine deaminase [Kiloniella sp. b19]|uniref:adenosine deaminase n=1 Tax=Kiloniella sp. GXU_MW_B19 TaxID=3141326 RepID=UPI0031E3C0F5